MPIMQRQRQQDQYGLSDQAVERPGLCSEHIEHIQAILRFNE